LRWRVGGEWMRQPARKCASEGIAQGSGSGGAGLTCGRKLAGGDSPSVSQVSASIQGSTSDSRPRPLRARRAARDAGSHHGSERADEEARGRSCGGGAWLAGSG
jgi:hypothetical protein